MKSFFLICFLAILSVGRNWLEVRPENIDTSPIIKSKTCKAIAQEKIVGGEEAVPHSYPYQVGILFEQYCFCGGSLISTEYILTAAHCFLFVRFGIIVALGSHNIKEQTDGELRIEIPETNVIIHEKFEFSFPFHDIALIKLPNPAELTQNIQPLHLPPRSLPDLTGKLVTATGWGDTSDQSEDVSPVLRYVEIKVISNVECMAYLPELIKDTHVCTSGEDGKSFCYRDSGGPLVIKESDKSMTIVGITSFHVGSGKCELGFPAAYTRITSYLDWISNHTGLAIKD